jgi:hypothetical protein
MKTTQSGPCAQGWSWWLRWALYDQDRHPRNPIEGQVEQFARGRVDPMNVLEHYQDGPTACQSCELMQQRIKQHLAVEAGLLFCRGVAPQTFYFFKHAVMTFRPEFRHAWSGQTHVMMLVLNRLGEHDGSALVEQPHVPLRTRVGIATGLVVVGDLIGSGASQEQAIVGETPPATLVYSARRSIVERADGVPLFVAELAADNRADLPNFLGDRPEPIKAREQ